MNLGGVEVVHWNPYRKTLPSRFGRKVPLAPRIGNFGDLIGPAIVRKLVSSGSGRYRLRPQRNSRLITVGSIVHLATDGDTLWGTGVNGKIPRSKHMFAKLDVRAVRGPLTAEFLREIGQEVPEVFGDPALLLPELFPEFREFCKAKKFEVTIVPNLNDLSSFVSDPRVLDPRTPLLECVRRIAESEFVVGSSLHGVVVAEALGIPAMFVESEHEDQFKYRDYLAGTGRPECSIKRTVEEALTTSGYPPIEWDSGRLLKAFPHDLWTGPRARNR